MESEVRIWQVGVLLEASFLPRLKRDPMKLIVSVGGRKGRSGVASVCKIGTLNTFKYANEYSNPSSNGCCLGMVDQTDCQYPSVLSVPLVEDNEIDLQTDVLTPLSLTSHDLQVVTGLPQKSEPVLLLASQHFMESYGFFTREQVWFRWCSSIPLKEVLLQVVGSSGMEVSTIATQLYHQDTVILHKGFNYAMPVHSSESIDEVCMVHVSHCSPVLQGRITKDTRITVLPNVTSPIPYMYANRRRRSLRAASKRFPQPELAREESSSECVIEAVCVPSYRLPSHYIVLPKETARKHNITDCQNVWVEAQQPDNRQATKLSEVTLHLRSDSNGDRLWRRRRHMAIVFLYEVEYELEQYVPTFLLGSEYDTVAMTMAYIHPELLFYLFPETLSNSRTFTIKIQRVKVTIPKVKSFTVKKVASPASEREYHERRGEMDHYLSEIKDHFSGRSVFLSVNDVFKVTSDCGEPLYYKVWSLGSDGAQFGILDAGSASTWECTIKPGKVFSYVPDAVPPSSIFPNMSLFDSISIPGLSQYTDKLFAFFLPAFRSTGSTKPHRSPSVLIHGPPGVGKHTVVKSVARRCRLHVVDLNCHEFTNEVVPAAEAKVHNSIESATSCCPVVIIFNNIHMLGRKSSIQEEPRICSLFEAYMSEVNKMNSVDTFPIFMVGITSKPSEVPNRVQALFLHQLDMGPPSQEERLAMMQSLSHSYHLSPEVDLTKLAQSTAGFVFSDIVRLFRKAYDKTVGFLLQYCNELGASDTGGVDINGVVLTQHHLNTVLSTLQSTQSDAIGAPKIPNVKWEDIGGLMEAKTEILDTIQLPLQYPHLFGSNLRRSGVLLYGAPGTGKTLLAKAVATECSLTFLSVKGPEVINMYVGQSEENIREVFSRARQCSPCVIFFDELDSIAPNRGRSRDSGGVMDRVVSQLLAELDGLHKSQDVFIIGATNRPDLIDPALLRPGRFDRLVYLGVNEDAAAKEKILKAITRKFQLAKDVRLLEVAQSCPSVMTGADLYALCSEAMMSALRRTIASPKGLNPSLIVEQTDFDAALKSVKPSITAEELKKYKNIQVTMTTN